MSWNRHPLFYSLKARTAFLYAGLFLISFAVIFGIVYLHLYLGKLETADRRLNGILSEFEYEYLTGEDFVSSLLPVTRLRRIPKLLLDRIEEELDGFQLILAFRNTERDSEFVLFGSQGETLWEITAQLNSEKFTRKRLEVPDRVTTLRKEFSRESYGEGNRIYFLLLDSTGKILAKSPFSEANLKSFQAFAYHPRKEIQYSNLQGARWRIRIAYRELFDGNCLVVGLNQHAADENLEKIANAFLLVGVSVFLLSALCAWLLACRMIRGVEKVGQAADRIAAGDYSLRVPAASDGLEIEELISSFNTMTENTETLMQELRTIADDIAHDLRTPLTRMLGRSEVTVAGHPTPDTLLETLGDNAEDCRRMLTLINQMLDLSKTESGAGILHKKLFDLGDLLRRSVELFRMVTDRKGQTLTCRIPPGETLLCADPMRIQQLIANLLDNASKFTPEGGTISAEITEEQDEILLTVSDTGCGIPESDRQKVFKRFFRADASRNLPGNGLGLAMVQAIVHAHGGRVDLTSVVGRGSTFRVHLPKGRTGKEKQKSAEKESTPRTAC